jgi:cyclophilin family peptidyl-prolyl cis-trans isomerase
MAEWRIALTARFASLPPFETEHETHHAPRITHHASRLSHHHTTGETILTSLQKNRPLWGTLLLVLSLSLILAACGTSDLPTTPGDGDAAPQSTPIPVREVPAGDGAAAALDPMDRVGMYDAPPPMTIDPETYYYATLVTEKGDVRVQLFADRAPMTVNNFVFLAREGYYDNTTFHRVLDDFMAQAGDPSGTGAGGPGYQFRDEFYPGLVFDKPGQLAMANAGPGTNGSQFFITFIPTDWLTNRHTIFGEVLEGFEVLDALTRRDPQVNPGFDGDILLTVLIEEGGESELATPTPAPPTPTPTVTPTPFAPSSLAPDDLLSGDRPLAQIEPAERTGYFNSPPEMVIDPEQTYTAIIRTSQGEITVNLYADEAPTAVNNFVVLASLGFFDGTPINDISPDQAMIIGSPGNDPESDAGYSFESELGGEREWGIGAVGYLPVPDPFTGRLFANSSQLIIAFIVPPPESAFQISFFGEVAEASLGILQQLTPFDVIEEIVIEVGE